MRIFTDSTGQEWTVFEVKRHGSESSPWSYLPEQFGSGWLCFESDTSKRRLYPVPAGWREQPDGELRRLLQQARSVERPRFPREEEANDAV